MLRIAILGGTGQLGRQLAEGWSRAGHLVLLGSRDPVTTAARVAAWDASCSVAGHVEAVEDADLVVFATPADAADSVARLVAPHLGASATVLSVMVPLEEGDPTRYAPPAEGSTAEHLASLMPKGTSVVAGFHTVSAGVHAEEGDVLICGSGKEARLLVARLAEDLRLRAVDCGPLRMAGTLERLTPLLIGVNRRLHVRGAGVRITGLGGSDT